METLKIDVLNPKAMKLLRDLADLRLIAINPTKEESSFSNLLKRLRNKSDKAPSFDTITKEVELVRAKRYGQ